MGVDELAPRVCPTGHLRQLLLLESRVVTGVGVGVQIFALAPAQEFQRAIAAAIEGKIERHQVESTRPVAPHARRLGFLIAFDEQLHGRVIGADAGLAQDDGLKKQK